MSSLSGSGQGRFYIIGNCISYYIKKPPAGCALARRGRLLQTVYVSLRSLLNERRRRPATRSVREYARTQFICLKGNFAARDIQMRCEVSGRADIIEQGVVG